MKPLGVWREEALANTCDYLIENLLADAPGEYRVTAGRSGIGKSILHLQMAFCLATGRPFLGLPVKQCRVGYMVFEGGRRQLLERITKMEQNFPDVGDYLQITKASWFPLSKHWGMKKLQGEISGLKVVILDPWRYVTPSEAKEVGPVVNALKDALQANGTVAIIVCHVRKRDPRYLIHPENLIDEVKGATDLVDSAASVLLLEREPQSHGEKGQYMVTSPDNRVLYVAKAKDSAEDLPPFTLTLNRDKLLFEKRQRLPLSCP